MKANKFKISEIQISYSPKVPNIERLRISSSADAYRQLLLLFDPVAMNIKEEAVVLFLNRGSRLIGGYKLSCGGITCTVVDIRLILGLALKCLATGIILAHSHPSGELKPSKQDIGLTEKLRQAAEIMDLKLLDHLIVTPSAYYSFEDDGIL